MKREVQVYIEGELLELFNDELINVNSSVQNISDISKVFTDFSQSFTVPASPQNNKIFQHFYNSDVNATIDQNLRRTAWIEIDLTPFRSGKIQLEKANIKNGQVDSYSITFYGSLISLKDKFGENKLKDLNLSSLNSPFTATAIHDRITDLATDYDVRYPLIASDRVWTYNVGPENICSTAKAIEYDELFPAVKIVKLFEAIENDYGITFQGTYLEDPRFTKCFLWCKNTNTYSWISESQPIDFDAIVTTVVGGLNPYDPSDYISLTDNSIHVQYLTDVTTHQIEVQVTSKSAAGRFYIDVFQNGNLIQTLSSTTTGGLPVIYVGNTSGLDSIITFKVRAKNAMVLDYSFTYTIRGTFIDPSTGLPVISNNYSIISTNTNTIVGDINLSNVIPDMKVADFFSGILKEFNMTCIGIKENVYEILPLDNWYNKGAVVDVTKYTITDEVDVERIKLYKKIKFKYQESESFVNKDYFKAYEKQYGDLEYEYNYDGGEYTVESPFENLLFARAVDNAGKEAILGYALNETFQAYTPKPCLFYLYGESEILNPKIKLYDGSGHLDITTYALFGQDLTYENTKYSLNFGADNSIIHLEPIQQSLFATYYFGYLTNLYNLKNRLINVKTILPISLLTNLQLNDRLIIRDKRYIINEMKSNLTTGEVDFSLYLDFRPVTPLTVATKPNTASCSKYLIDLPNGCISGTLSSATAGVTFSINPVTVDSIIDICIPANTTGVQRTITILISYTFKDGSTASNNIYIIQDA